MKILYLHGRPSAHPAHATFAKALNAKFQHVDKPIRWQDKKYPGFLNLFFNGINAFFIPSKYDVYLVDGLHFSPIINKKIFFWRNKKYIVHLGSHTLYFMHAGLFSSLNTKIHKTFLSMYDGAMCEGAMAGDFINNLLTGKKKPVSQITFLGPDERRQHGLLNSAYNPFTLNLIIIGSASNDSRIHYKGHDIMLEAFQKAKQQLPGLTVTIIGESSLAFKNKYSHDTSIIFTDHVTDIVPELKNVSLGLHISRGDAFPTSTIELMSAGIPVFVSTITGTKSVVNTVSEEFVLPVDADKVAEKIIWFMQLDSTSKQDLSNKFRSAVANYTMENAVERYIEAFKQICDETK